MTKQLALARRPRPRPLASAPPELTIQAEALHDIANELAPLFVRFWQESGKDDVPLDPDWTNLLRMSVAGALRVVTVRDGGSLEGFMLNTVHLHLFCKSVLHGSTIAYWLNPIHRVGWFPVRLARRNVEFLREWGCKRIFVAVDSAFKDGRASRIFERLGYRKTETHYVMVL